jgi:hypothetical protein
VTAVLGARLPRASGRSRSRTLVAVLGMHRSGTSATAGILQELGIELGAVSEQARFNARGNREIRELNRLHNAILDRSGGSWWDPPAEARLKRGDFRRRDQILDSIPGTTIGVKDPRMLVVPELWDDLGPRPIGVIRNPVAVRRSLERRGRERESHPELPAARWEELWTIYNRALLRALEAEPFPVIDFDRHSDLDAQIRSALAFHGIAAGGDSSFFDRGLVGPGVEEWRSQVAYAEAVELWDELAELARRDPGRN